MIVIKNTKLRKKKRVDIQKERESLCDGSNLDIYVNVHGFRSGEILETAKVEQPPDIIDCVAIGTLDARDRQRLKMKNGWVCVWGEKE